MKYTLLDEEEKQILKDYEDGKYVSVQNKDEWMKVAKKAAKNTREKMRKDAMFSMRSNAYILDRFKLKAAKKGIPYQTIINAFIYQYVEDMIEIKL